MRVMIIGFSGSGKSTLAQKIGTHYQIPILHLDSIFFKPNWVEKTFDEMNEGVKDFLEHNSSWVIDGNYNKYYFDKRAQLADIIIYMNFNRFTCLKNVYRRYFKYRGKSRESAAPGCDEKVDFKFFWWVLFKGRKKSRVNRFKELQKRYPDKFVEIKTYKETERLLNQL